MSLADRFGGGLPRGFASGNQALERLLEELGTAGAQMGSSLEGLDLSWAEPDLGLGGLSLPLPVDQAEAAAAASPTGEARRAVRPAARAGAPGGGSVSHGTSASGAAALVGRRLPAGGAPQGLGLLAELAIEYQQARVGGAVATNGQGRSGPGHAAPASAPDPARRRGEAQMRPASVTERERFVPGHGQVPDETLGDLHRPGVAWPVTQQAGSGVEQQGAGVGAEGSRSRSHSTGAATAHRHTGPEGLGRETERFDSGFVAGGRQLGHVGARLGSSGIHPAPAFSELTEVGRALAEAAPGLDGVDHPLAAWSSGPLAARSTENHTERERVQARAAHQAPAARWQGSGASPLPPEWGESSPLPLEWGGNWQPLYVAGSETDQAADDGDWTAPGIVPAVSREYAAGDEPAKAAELAVEGQPSIAPGAGPTVGPKGHTAGPAGIPPAAVPAPDLDSVLSSALASAVGGLPGLGPIPGISGNPTINWTPSTPTVPAGAEGARQQVNLSMQVQLQGGQAAAAPAGDDLARRIKEILIAEARRHGIDL